MESSNCSVCTKCQMSLAGAGVSTWRLGVRVAVGRAASERASGAGGSRDGGVDCVAYDTRPICGGKVVIQAKRYKHTVGVSAVRDLFGTLQNEGASKGILVTTSGYGKSSFEFAAGKPLELLSGTHLLYLLSEHAGVEAKIEMPENWQDPLPDS